MKKVLMISYFFPPMGGVAVQRITKFCKFLPEFGWQPIVLTVKNGYWTVWDHSNEDHKTGYEVVYRTPFISPFTLINKLSFGKAKFGTTSEDKGKALDKPSRCRKLMRQISMLWCVPDEFISWFPIAFFYGLKIIKKHGVDLIYANDSPHTCPLIALALNKTTGLPFITDFRDLWIANPEFNPRNGLEMILQKKLERIIIKKSNQIITVTNGFANVLAKTHGEKQNKKLTVIYNGFDMDDFENSYSGIYQKGQKTFRIVYTGSFFGTLMTPENFLIAFSRFVRNYNLHPSEIEIIFAGAESEQLKILIEKTRTKNYIKVLPNLSHRNACSLQKSADLLLFIIHSCKGGKDRVSAKLFEYLAAGPPIFAIIPHGEAANIIEKTASGMLANPDDVAEIEASLTSLYEKIHIKKEPFQRNEAEIRKFNRRDQTKRLAEIFDEVTEARK
ncbi:MAG: glycosyltransferase [candidate division KSB1 bacterium]|nr:glycosyltransferase [candidate division KSB1 bacterium]